MRGSSLMPTNKQDKRDGPTTEEQKPHPGTPNPCTLLPLLPLFFSISLYLSRSLSLTLSHISPLILQHSVSLYFLLFYPLQHVSHLNPVPPLSLLDKYSSFFFFFFFCQSKAKRKKEFWCWG